jgi:hypothetical protein
VGSIALSTILLKVILRDGLDGRVRVLDMSDTAGKALCFKYKVKQIFKNKGSLVLDDLSDGALPSASGKGFLLPNKRTLI